MTRLTGNAKSRPGLAGLNRIKVCSGSRHNEPKYSESTNGPELSFCHFLVGGWGLRGLLGAGFGSLVRTLVSA